MSDEFWLFGRVEKHAPLPPFLVPKVPKARLPWCLRGVPKPLRCLRGGAEGAKTDICFEKSITFSRFAEATILPQAHKENLYLCRYCKVSRKVSKSIPRSSGFRGDTFSLVSIPLKRSEAVVQKSKCFPSMLIKLERRVNSPRP